MECFEVISEDKIMEGCIQAAMDEIDELENEFNELQARYPSPSESEQPCCPRPRQIQSALDDLWDLQRDRRRDVRVFEALRPDLARFLLLHSVPGLACSVPRMSVDMKIMTETARSQCLRSREYNSAWIQIANDLHRIWETTQDGRHLYHVRRWHSMVVRVRQRSSNENIANDQRYLDCDGLRDKICSESQWTSHQSVDARDD